MRATTARLARLTTSSSHPPTTATTSKKSSPLNNKIKSIKKKPPANKNAPETEVRVKRPYNKKSAAIKRAERLAALLKEQKLVTVKRNTTKVPKVVKTKIVKVKPLKRLIKAKAAVPEKAQEGATSTSTNAADDKVVAAKVPKKTKITPSERQASPKRGKSQSPARAAKPAASATVTKQPKAKKNADSTPLTRKKKIVKEKIKSNKPTGLKRGRKAGTKNMAKDQQQAPALAQQQPTEVVETAKKTTAAAKKKRASSQDSISGSNPPEIPVIPADLPPEPPSLPPTAAATVVVKSAKKTKEKPAPKTKDNIATTTTPTITKKLPKKLAVAKKPKITQQEKSDYEKGVEEIDVNESLIKIETTADTNNQLNDKKFKFNTTKLTVAGMKKKKMEIKKIEEEEEEAKNQAKLKSMAKEKKEKLPRKVMVPPKKRAMAPLKKRLAASAALEMGFKPPPLPPPPVAPISSPVRSPEAPKKEEYSSSDDATLDVVLKLMQQRQQQEQAQAKPPATKKTPVNKGEPKRKKIVKKKVEKQEDSSSAPSSPEPAPKKTKKIIKRVPKSAAAKKNSKIKALVALKKRNLQVDKIRKKVRAKNLKKGKKRYSSSGSDSDRHPRHTASSDEERSNRLKVFGFWTGPKRHRVASLNAIAKVHCLYENEARHTPAMFLAATAGKSGTAVTTTTTTTTNISTRTLRSGPARSAGRHWYDSASSSDSSSSPESPPSGAMVPYRRRRNSSGSQHAAPTANRKKSPSKPATVTSSSVPSAAAGSASTSTASPPRKVVRRKRCDMIMDLKDMVVRKRMASLNASAILAASYSFEKRTPSKSSSCTTSSVEFKVKVQQQSTTTSIQNHVVAEVESSDLDSVPTSPNLQTEALSPEQNRSKKPATVTSKRNSTSKKGKRENEVKAPPKKRKRHPTEDSDVNAADEEDEDDDPLAKVIKLRAPKKVALIMNDTDVTITGVYVNTRSTEGYCISGMEYRISSTSHTQTEATTVLQRGPHLSQAGPQPPPSSQQPPEHVSRHHHLHHHHHHHAPVQPTPEHPGFRPSGECDPAGFVKPQPPQSYTPLGALSSMQPPASLQQHGVPAATSTQQMVPPPQSPLRVHHGGPSPLGRHGSSAFSAPPSAYGAPPPPPDASPYLHAGYYQPAGPLIHAGGSELCRASSKLGGLPSAPPQSQPPSTLLLAPPPGSVSEHSETRTEASTSASPLPPPPTHIVSSQGSPFRHYTPYPSYTPQYHHAPPQYYHPHTAPQSALVAASHHLPPPAPQDLCYSSCYSPHYKYPPYRRYPHQHFYPAPPSHQADVYSLPGPSSSSSSSFQPPSAPAPSSSSAPSQHQQEAGSSSSSSQPPPSSYPPPPTLSQQPPEPPPTYQFYPGYSPGPGACYSHAPPPRGVAFLDASYQSCPCPMQSCPKNVHTGPLTGDSKGPGPQETLFVMPPVAAAAAAHPTSASRGPLPPGHPPSPARGSSGGPPVAQGPSPPATAADQSRNQQSSPEAPAWVAAEPTPPPSDDSSAPRGPDTDLCDSVESTADVNQNYHGSTKKRRLSISARLDTKKMKTMPTETQFPPLDSTNVFSSINEPLLITTTMLQSNKKLEESTILRENFDIKNNNVEMPSLPPTPPTSADTSPPLKPKIEKPAKVKGVRKPYKLKAANPQSPTKRKQQRPSKRNLNIIKNHFMQESLEQTFVPVSVASTLMLASESTDKTSAAKLKVKHSYPKSQVATTVTNTVAAMTKPLETPLNNNISSSNNTLILASELNNIICTPSSTSITSSTTPSISVSKPQASPPKTKPPVSNCSPKPRKNSKCVPSATDATLLPGNLSKPAEEEPPMVEENLMKAPAPIKKGGKRKSSPSINGSIKKSKKQLAAEAIAAAREAEVTAQNDLLKKAILRKTLTPKWSNGWSWEGEPFQAKVFLRNDDAPVLRNCYPAMRHEEGDVVVARDCVLLKSGTRKGDLPYVAKVSALWENPDDGEMMVSLLWYYRPEHTDKGRKPEDMLDEIFASKHKDNSSVACIEDKCYVLTFNEYCRYRGIVRQIEEGALLRPLVVPQLPPILSCGRESRMPSNRVAPDLVFFCRKVYDFRQKRMLKNPG